MLSKIIINNLKENGIGNKNSKDFQTDFNVLHLFGYTCRAYSSEVDEKAADISRF